MKRIGNFLFNGIAKMPWIFFAAAILCWAYSELFMGGINWRNDAYEQQFAILSILSIATTVLMVLFPVVAICMLIYNPKNWRRTAMRPCAEPTAPSILPK